jgi:hypothetical protein
MCRLTSWISVSPASRHEECDPPSKLVGGDQLVLHDVVLEALGYRLLKKLTHGFE